MFGQQRCFEGQAWQVFLRPRYLATPLRELNQRLTTNQGRVFQRNMERSRLALQHAQLSALRTKTALNYLCKSAQCGQCVSARTMPDMACRRSDDRVLAESAERDALHTRFMEPATLLKAKSIAQQVPSIAAPK